MVFHLNYLIKFLIMILGFSYLIGIIIVGKGLKDSVSNYYFRLILFLLLFHSADFIYRYMVITSVSEKFNTQFILSTYLYYVISSFTVAIYNLTLSILKLNFRFKRIISNLIYFSYFIVYLISISYGDLIEISNRAFIWLWNIGMCIQFPITVAAIIIGLIRFSSIKSSIIRKQLKALFIVMLIYFPFMIYENFLINFIKWYPIETYLRLFHMVFVIWVITSSWIYFKSINSKEIDFLGQLTRREREVCLYLLDGKSAKEIAEICLISPRTVEKHIVNIYKKIGIRNRAELVKYSKDKSYDI